MEHGISVKKFCIVLVQNVLIECSGYREDLQYE